MMDNNQQLDRNDAVVMQKDQKPLHVRIVGVGAALTVRIASEEVSEPAILLTTHLKAAPLSESRTLLMKYDEEVHLNIHLY